MNGGTSNEKSWKISPKLKTHQPHGGAPIPVRTFTHVIGKKVGSHLGGMSAEHLSVGQIGVIGSLKKHLHALGSGSRQRKVGK